MNQRRSPKQTGTAAILLGMGLGGFVDGIVLHQIAQWHNMLSGKVPPVTMDSMALNMRADGWFHAAVWIFTLAGLLILYRAARQGAMFPSERWFIGVLIIGWGAFNLVEGIVNHHLLHLHHVRDLPVHLPVYDYVFLLFGGLGLIAIGWLISRGQVDAGN